MGRQAAIISEQFASTGARSRPEVIVLAVGEALSLRKRSVAEGAHEATTFADFSEVSGELIEALDPHIVVSSVLGRNFDCVDLAERLEDLGFRGRYRLIGYGVPQPDLVLREIRSLFPSLTVELETPPN
jgi:hypothetical protein